LIFKCVIIIRDTFPSFHFSATKLKYYYTYLF